MSGVRHGTTVDSLCIWCLVSRAEFCSVKFVVIRNMAGMLSAPEEYPMIMDRVSGMKVAIISRSEGKKW